MQNLFGSPLRAPPMKYDAPLGTRWEKEMEAAGGAAAFDLPTDPKAIGPWILGECVGKGASGRVKIAKHRKTGQLAAVKILPIAPLVSSRASLATQQARADKQRLGIDREITMMKLMNHPNIMRIYDVYESDQELFLVLEYVEGGELFDFLVNRGKLPPDEALIYFRQIVYGLNYAHTFSIIHRDLKPENILIASLSPPLIKIADWGMAAFAPPSLQLETSCGSPHYASPEIVNGEKYQGNATDIWSCGVILYALLTGRLPFDDKELKPLLTKVRSGIYEFPPWMDPMAMDLISRMLVVDVRHRITIPQILSHPWLVSQPVIPFAAHDGCIYTLLPPPLPPSPRVLARPVASPDLIDLELFSSLRIIWGRHADAAGESIRRDLCSPAGQGVHAKAFYFLLNKYRNESSKHREDDFELGSKACLGMNAVTLSDFMVAGPSTGLRKYEVPQRLFLSPQVSSKGRARAPLSPLSANIILGPRISSRKRRVTDGTISTEKGPSQVLTSSRLASNHRGQLKTQIPTATGRDNSGVSFRPKAALGGAGRGSGPGPLPARREHTYSMLPDRRNGGTQLAGTSVRFSQQLIPKTASVNSAATSSKRPNSSIGPLPTATGTRKLAPYMDSTPRPVINTVRQILGSPRSLVTPKINDDKSPVANDVEPSSVLQRTMDDITQRLNDIDLAVSKTPSVDRAQESNKSTISRALAQSHRRLRGGGDKENQTVDDDWKQITAEEVDSGGVGLGVGNVLANRDVGKDIGNLPVSSPKSKREKEKKGRPPPLELPSLNHKRSTLATVGSPIVLSSPIYLPPSANKSMASPAVSDFKGWFSNLFNWKTPTANGGVVYSPDSLQVTRSTVSRIIEEMGVVVSKGQGDSKLGEVLFCRIDHPTTDAVTGLPLKNVRFKVEFRASVEPSEPQYMASLVGGEFGTSLRPNGNGGLNSPVVNAFSGPASSRPRASFLLGGRSTSHGTPLPSPALASAFTKTDAVLPPGCSCAVALIHEKGSISTFKLVWRRLKDEYGDMGSGYPCFSPAIPNTPCVEGHQGMVV